MEKDGDEVKQELNQQGVECWMCKKKEKKTCWIGFHALRT